MELLKSNEAPYWTPDKGPEFHNFIQQLTELFEAIKCDNVTSDQINRITELLPYLYELNKEKYLKLIWEQFNSRLPKDMRFATLPKDCHNMIVADTIDVGSRVWIIQVLPDGRIVSGSLDDTIKIWTKNPSGEWSAETLGEHENAVTTLQVLSDDKIVSGSHDHTIKIWTKNSSGEWSVETLKSQDFMVTTLQVLPDGRIVSGSWDKKIKVWQVKEDN